MKRYTPFFLVAAGIVGALWYFWPDVLAARKKRDDDLNTLLAKTDSQPPLTPAVSTPATPPTTAQTPPSTPAATT